MAHAINWFEIPATNFERAKTFYETVLEHQNVNTFPANEIRDVSCRHAKTETLEGD